MEGSGRRSPSPLYSLVSLAPAPVAQAVVLGIRVGGLDAATGEALGAEGVVVVLFVIALWDLVVRWGRITEVPLLTGPAPQQLARRLLRHVGPPIVLVAGIALGHRFWT